MGLFGLFNGKKADAPAPEPEKKVIEPQFVCIFKMTKENSGEVLALQNAPAFDTSRFVNLGQKCGTAFLLTGKPNPSHFQRVDTSKAPFLLDGGKTRAYLWNDPEQPLNPHRMIAIYASVETLDNGDVEILPQSMILGKNVAAVMVYQLGCCGGLSACVTYPKKDATRVLEIRDSLPMPGGAGVTLEDKRNFFANKTYVADEGVADGLLHLYKHAIGACSENHPDHAEAATYALSDMTPGAPR